MIRIAAADSGQSVSDSVERSALQRTLPGPQGRECPG